MVAFDARRYAELARLMKEKVNRCAEEFDTRLPLEHFLDQLRNDPEMAAWEREREQLRKEVGEE